MKGLDTNIIVAWILGAQDSNPLRTDTSYRISLIVLAELVWVFDRTYKRSRDEIAAIVARLAATDGLQFESSTTVLSALDDYRNGTADFADYLLMRDGEEAGCVTTLTYDKQAARHAGFTLLERY